MVNLRTLFSRRIVSLTMALSLVCLPLSSTLVIFADDPAPCTPPPASTTFHYPNGADSSTFTYNCTTGLWENPHFSYDPSSGLRTPTDPIVYTCDPATNTFNVTTWSYSPAQGTFIADTQNVTSPPAGATVVACPPPPVTTNDVANQNSDPVGSSGGSSTINNSLDNNATLNNTNNLDVNNTLNSTALSGNAMLLGNTTVGNATTGDATLVANELNMLQSSNNFGASGQPVTFVANINGDVNGNFLLDPSTISNVQPATNTSTTNNLNNNLTINNTTNATLDNTLNLSAGSGDVTANANTTVGNVQTGNANAVADIVNTINSAILAGHSFLGVVNINGNLNGDILLPPDFVNQLLADNVPTVTITGPGTGSTNSTNTNVNNTTNVTNTNNQGINNNVKASAASGSATASDNTTTGNLTTGNANTNITAFNLTGSQVIGSNDLLVFVNVLGKWVGLIVNAPAGTTAAEFGGGITTTEPNSTNTSNTNVNNNSNINNKTNQQINNNINVNALSGNATANRNTTVGNVGSGNADAAVNLLNVENSTFSLSNWFGILFINVFGTWNGSFGIAPVNTGPVASAGNTGSIGGISAGSGGSSSTTIPEAFHFVPTNGSGNFNIVPLGSGSSNGGITTSSTNNSVLAAHVKANSVPTPALTPGHINWLLAGSGISAFFVYLLAERFYTIRRSGASKA